MRRNKTVKKYRRVPKQEKKPRRKRLKQAKKYRRPRAAAPVPVEAAPERREAVQTEEQARARRDLRLSWADHPKLAALADALLPALLVLGAVAALWGAGVPGAVLVSCAGVLLWQGRGKEGLRRLLSNLLGSRGAACVLYPAAAVLGLVLTLWLALWALAPGLTLPRLTRAAGGVGILAAVSVLVLSALTALDGEGGRSC